MPRTKRPDHDPKSRQGIPISTKIAICQEYEKNPFLKLHELCDRFKIKSKSTVGKIIKEKEDFLILALTKTNKNAKRQITLPFPLLEERMIEWVEEFQENRIGERLTDKMIGEQAQKVANELHYTDFRASMGWVYNFKKRHAITAKDLQPPASDNESLPSGSFDHRKAQESLERISVFIRDTAKNLEKARKALEELATMHKGAIEAMSLQPQERSS